MLDATLLVWLQDHQDVHAIQAMASYLETHYGQSGAILPQSFNTIYAHAFAGGELPQLVADPKAQLLAGAIFAGVGIGGASLGGLKQEMAGRSSGTEHLSYQVEPKKGVVIGKLRDLNAPGSLRPGEGTLDLPDQGSVQRNWKQNSGRLRTAMQQGNPIRDASDPSQWNGPLRLAEGTVDMSTYGGFLRAERELMMNGDWWYNYATGYWYSPGW